MLNGNQCGTEVKDVLKSLNPEITGEAEEKLEEKWQAICTAIFAHIQANGKAKVMGVEAGDQTIMADIL